MNNIIKKTLTMALLFSMTCGIVGVSIPKQASAKTASKVTKVITLTNKNKNGITHKLSISKKEKVAVKIRFLQVKGKLSKKATNDDLYFGYYEGDFSKGTFFTQYSKPGKLKKTSFKKGKSLDSSKTDYISGKNEVIWNLPDWDLPNGIKKLKVQITYYTKSGRKGIKSVK